MSAMAVPWRIFSTRRNEFVRLGSGSRAYLSVTRLGSCTLTTPPSLKKGRGERNNNINVDGGCDGDVNCVQSPSPSLDLARRCLSLSETQNQSRTALLRYPRNARHQSTASSPTSSASASALASASASASSSAPTHKPSHPTLIRVVHSPDAYASWAESLVDLPAGAHFASFEDATPVARQRYSTVQVSSAGEHIELNSDLRFANHSCDPSLVFDTARMEARVVDERALRVGDELTFFYPSTEWEMDRPFACQCRDGNKGKVMARAGRRECKGWIAGAKALSETERALEGYWINRHIRVMLEQEERKREREGERCTP